MLILKRLLFLGAVFVAASAMVMAQSRTSSDRELSVEQSYLQESVELMIIREQSRAESRDMKLVALEYIGDAIGRGNKSDEIRAVLEYLSMEGVLNKTMENGRVINNYPDVRLRAATQLGQLGTPEAKDALIKMTRMDTEPMVITEAIKSLATIGLNDNDETIAAISWVVDRFNTLNPDNLMALIAVNAFEKFAAANNGILSEDARRTIYLIVNNGAYERSVRDRARQLVSLRRPQ